MGVPHRRRDARVAHEFLDGREVNASKDEAGREGVAKVVKPAAGDTGSLDRFQERCVLVHRF